MGSIYCETKMWRYNKCQPSVIIVHFGFVPNGKPINDSEADTEVVVGFHKSYYLRMKLFNFYTAIDYRMHNDVSLQVFMTQLFL